ncbi:hypothetical protein [Paenibacillus sp. IHBB 10380]|uniref:hypothetical protein n=1 Tax=Paenibacillus sp. IHBB 10380 TaxID=1566358 RepID=UPI0005CFCCA3|nr:hypothetical protein [Paenibacillus sp. IHBB 10380]AJS61120.1 hypothetical protein UB51_24810 [Paenibacillus sp. IHBB 10380]
MILRKKKIAPFKMDGTTTIVKVLCKDESEAMVIHFVRLEPQGEYIEKSQQKMGNPSVKSFGNPQGKEFTMSESELVMTAKEGLLYISMNGSHGITLNSSTTVHIQSTESLNLQGNEVHIEASEGLNIMVNADKLDLVEDVNMTSNEIVLSALKGYETTYPAILSEFEQQVADKGIEQVKSERIIASMIQQNKAGNQEAWGMVVGLGNMVKDAGDYVLTKVIENVLFPSKNVLGIRTKEEAKESQKMADVLAQGIYYQVSGELNPCNFKKILTI